MEGPCQCRFDPEEGTYVVEDAGGRRRAVACPEGLVGVRFTRSCLSKPLECVLPASLETLAARRANEARERKREARAQRQREREALEQNLLKVELGAEEQRPQRWQTAFTMFSRWDKRGARAAREGHSPRAGTTRSRRSDWRASRACRRARS